MILKKTTEYDLTYPNTMSKDSFPKKEIWYFFGIPVFTKRIIFKPNSNPRF